MKTYSATSLALTLLLTACSGEGDTPDPQSGQVSLSIEKLSWIHRHNEDRNRLSISVKISNPMDGSTLPLVPGQFSLETKEGTGVPAILAPEGKVVHHCPTDLTLLADAERTCTYWFDIPQNETPRRLALTPPGGETIYTGDFEACSGSGGQLCNYGQLCQSGQCVESCARSTTQGACEIDGFRCVLGKCVGACSSEHPDGYCDQGGCYEGRCVDEFCLPVKTISRTSCNSCVQNVCRNFPSSCVRAENCGDECLSCLMTNIDICACQNSKICSKACVSDFRGFLTDGDSQFLIRCRTACRP